ncbi:MAG: ABC transporter ATP-binding protein [Humibacillus sp.]|nr:ABC transporter ATP-binding protein [Humibacillus sp.]MDN5779968.1 ABC transporter ATP-binding protein [Humibacillus sp.]
MTTTQTRSASAPTHDGPAAAIQLDALTKSFGSVQAVRGIDLTVRRGEVVAILGPNGAGKTTTIDMVLGLAQPTSGAVSVFGLPPREAIRRGLVAAVMQSGGLLGDLTVRETVAYVAELFPRSRPVEEVMTIADIAGIGARLVKKCSGGEQQRLRYAMALVSDPELVILDEPTTGMDVASRRAFWEHIHADAGTGRTIVFATHYLEEADAWADRVVLVREGQVVADGTPAEVKASATGRTVRCTWPGVAEADVHSLSSIDGVDGVDVRGATVMVQTRQSDQLARHLLTQTSAHDVEITAHGLEDAFVALTCATTPEEN